MPVDFLLTNNTEDSGGSIEDWIQEHQDNLRAVYSQAGKRVQRRLERRNLKHDMGVRDVGFQEGELVYLKKHQVRGRNKIQDAWNSCLYRVVRCLEGQGTVYSVVPIEQEGPAKQVHRSELRSVGAARTTIAVMSDSEEDSVSEATDLESTGEESMCVMMDEYEAAPTTKQSPGACPRGRRACHREGRVFLQAHYTDDSRTAPKSFPSPPVGVVKEDTISGVRV